MHECPHGLIWCSDGSCSAVIKSTVNLDISYRHESMHVDLYSECNEKDLCPKDYNYVPTQHLLILHSV